MSTHRGYSLVELKAAESSNILTGIATTPTLDRVGDVVEPRGVRFKNPLPLLLFHDARLPVGQARFKAATDKGIEFEATFADPGDSQTLRERIAEAKASVKAGLIRGVSIGFRALEDGIETLKSGGLRFTKTEVMELSLVVIPANQDATITAIKHYATGAAATGQVSDDGSTTAGASASVVRLARKGARTMPKTYSERVAALENERATKAASIEDIQTKASDEGRTKNESEREEFTTLKAEIASIDAELSDLKDLAAMNLAKAVPANGNSQHAAAESRQPAYVSVTQDHLPKGIGLARYAMASIHARQVNAPVSEVAKARWPSDARLQMYIKATVPAGLTTDANWAGNLVDQTNLASEFIEYLRPQTIVGRIPNLRRVPFNVRITGQSTGAVANWVGQGKGKPVTSFSTLATTLLYTKIAAIAVITEELARFSSPSAEMLVRDELARAVIERMDVDFIDPAHSAVANVNPASITNGLTALSSAGTSADNVRTDLQNLLEQFILNNLGASNVVLVMPNTLALAASLLTNAFGQPEFPDIGVNGGSLRGVPVVTSQYAANQSGAGNLVIALDPTQIFLADDGQVTLDASREASIQMSDAPTVDASTGTGQSLVSMYQTNSVAIRAERFINWAKARTTAVVYMDDVNWGAIGSPS